MEKLWSEKKEEQLQRLQVAKKTWEDQAIKAVVRVMDPYYEIGMAADKLAEAIIKDRLRLIRVLADL